MKKLLLTVLLLAPLFGAELSLTTEDGYELHGWLDKPTRCLLKQRLSYSWHISLVQTILHGIRLPKSYMKRVWRHSSVDLRGHGKSGMQKGVENKVQIPKNTSEVRTAFDASAQKVGFTSIPQDLIAWLELARRRQKSRYVTALPHRCITGWVIVDTCAQ